MNSQLGKLEIHKEFEKIEENENTKYLIKELDYSQVQYRLTAKEDIIDFADNSIIYHKGDIIGEYSLDESSSLILENIPMGRFLLQEIKTISGMILDKTIYEVNFEQKDNITKVYTKTFDMKNLMTTVELKKMCIADNKTNLEYVNNSILSLYEVIESNEKEELKLIDEWETKDNSHIVKGLKVGTKCRLIETKTSNGFVTATPIDFVVEDTTDTQKIIMVDKQVTVSKKDVGGNEVEGATIQVIDKETNEVIDEWVSTKEEHIVKNLVENKTYILHEKVCAENYVFATDVEFTVSDEKVNEHYDLVDKQVTVSKKDVGGNEVEGATIQVIDKETNKVMDEWVSTKEEHIVNGLEENKIYILHELVAAENYVLATDVEFTVSDEKVNEHYDLINKQLQISKKDITTNEELPGAELTVTDKDGNVIDKWISTKEPHVINGLEEGKKYTLTEITAPYGYELTESIEFEVSFDKENQLVEMKDMPILKSVQVEKLDKNTKEHIKSNKFVFGIYEDEACTKLIREAGANEYEGTVLFDNLKYGVYYIKEVKAPTGYKLSDQIVKIEINDKGVFADGVSLEEKDGVYSFEYYNSLLPKIQTGDETNYLLLGSIAVMSLIGAIGGIVLLRKKHNEK